MIHHTPVLWEMPQRALGRSSAAAKCRHHPIPREQTMLTGSLIIGFQMPKIPDDEDITPEQASKLVIDRMNEHLKERHIEPSRYTWLERNDVPEIEDEMPKFIQGCIQEAGIDQTKVNVKPASGSVCCFWGTRLVYYYSFSLQWSGAHDKDPFTVKVEMTPSWTAVIPLACTLAAHRYLLRSGPAAEGSVTVEFPASRSTETKS